MQPLGASLLISFILLYLFFRLLMVNHSFAFKFPSKWSDYCWLVTLNNCIYLCSFLLENTICISVPLSTQFCQEACKRDKCRYHDSLTGAGFWAIKLVIFGTKELYTVWSTFSTQVRKMTLLFLLNMYLR